MAEAVTTSTASADRPDTREAALALAARGYAVVPGHTPAANGCTCMRRGGCASPGKHARARNGIKDATTDPGEIRRRFRADDNIIMATGAVSGGVVVLDIDGEAGVNAMRDLLGAHGADSLPATVTARSGGGGLHYLFAVPEDVERVPNRTGIVPSVDVRGDGGGIVAPPSRHASGRTYAWVDGRSPDDVAVAEAPRWLIDLVLRPAQERKSGPRATASSGKSGDTTTESRTKTYGERALDGEAAKVLKAEEGTRNDTLFRAAATVGELVGADVVDRGEAERVLTRAAASTGLSDDEIAATLKSGLDRGVAQPREIEDTEGGDRRRPNTEALARRRKALHDDRDAMGWLRARGIDDRTIEAFDLGLVDQEVTKSSKRGKRPYRRALSMPLRRAEGPVNRFVHTAMPGVTTAAPAQVWATGEPETFHARPDAGQSTVIVARPQDLLALWTLLRDTAVAPDVQIIASSKETLPSRWTDVAFWDRWSAVHVATPRGDDETATLILRSASKPVRRLLPPDGRDTWLDFLAAGGTADAAADAMRAADQVEQEISGDDDARRMGRLPYQPVDIGRAYHGGHLYYPMRTLMRETVYADDGSAEIVEGLETVVIRSDGKVLSAREMPCKPGTPQESRVWRLTDGTLIDEPPAPARSPSWSWKSVESWLESRRAGEEAGRPLADLVREARDAIVRTVWLPNAEDATALAFLVAVSYVQPVFKAVPYALVTGERGTGKSALGVVLSQLGANGNVIGQTSAASAARMMHEGRGLVVFDDLEGIGAKRGADAAFTELIQWLKVSYNQDTAKKVWTDAGAGYRVRTLNGFGVKIINNTTGSDGILGSRMIRVGTRRMPDTVARERAGTEPPAPSELERLRDDLHVWAFESVQRVDAVYRATVSPQDREQEIAAPLRVLATVAGDAELQRDLEAALARSRDIASSEAMEPPDVIREAAATLVRQGYYTLAPLAVSMEARRLVGETYGRSHAAEITEIDDTTTVGRYLRSLHIIDPDATRLRERLFGVHLRFYPVSAAFLDEVFGDDPRPPERHHTEWCTVCATCPYAAQNCPVMQRRHG